MKCEYKKVFEGNQNQSGFQERFGANEADGNNIAQISARS